MAWPDDRDDRRTSDGENRIIGVLVHVHVLHAVPCVQRSALRLCLSVPLDVGGGAHA